MMWEWVPYWNILHQELCWIFELYLSQSFLAVQQTGGQSCVHVVLAQALLCLLILLLLELCVGMVNVLQESARPSPPSEG